MHDNSRHQRSGLGSSILGESPLRRRPTLAALAAVGAVAVGVAAWVVPASAAPGDTVVPGGKPAWTSGHAATGTLSASSQLTVTVMLGLRDQAGAAQLASAVADPTSGSYHRYLSATQFRDRFAPTAETVQQVTRWLTGAGLRVLSVPANRRYVQVSGTAAAVGAAFGTGISTYQLNGRTLHAATGAAHVPAALAGAVAGVEGLSSSLRTNVPQTRRDNTGDIAGTRADAPATAASRAATAGPSAPPAPAFVNAPPCSDYYGQKTATSVPAAYGAKQPYAPCGYVAGQLRGAYGTAAATAHGLTGAGTTVAVVDAYASPTILTDANTYARRNGQQPFARGQFRQILPPSFNNGYDDTVNGDTCGEQGWYGEETLDVEAVHSMAPGARVLYVAGASCNDSDLLTALNTIIDGQQAQIISNSWGGTGEPDPSADAALLAAYRQTFLQAALQGIGVFFSSGDNGDEVANTGVRTPDYPASDPWVTAVGGTSLGIGARNQYLFETGWGTTRSVLTDGAWAPAPPGDFLYGAGGGTSHIFDQPWYQRHVVPSSLSRYNGGAPARTVPDIATVGDPNTGMLVGQTQTFPNGSVRYGEYRIGGTSLSCPLMAGIEALADQASGYRHGFANPAIYDLAGSSAYRDVVPQSSTRAVVRVDYINGVDASDGLRTSLRTLDQTQSLATRRGYDDVTGVGSPNGLGYVLRLGD